jgi:hypothetical protein
MHQMASHLPDPSCIGHSACSNCQQTDHRDPFELLRSVEYNSHNVMGQLEQRDKAIFNASKGRPLGGCRHGLCKLLRCEVVDPQSKTRDGEEEEEDKCKDGLGGQLSHKTRQDCQEGWRDCVLGERPERKYNR